MKPNSQTTWRMAAIVAISAATLTLPVCLYVYATVSNNMKALEKAESGLSEDLLKTRFRNALNSTSGDAAGDGLTIDVRDFGSPDWSRVVPTVTQSTAVISVLMKPVFARYDAARLTIPGVKLNIATRALDRRPWHDTPDDLSRRGWLPWASGFVISDGRFIVTAAHAVDGVERFKVKLGSGENKEAFLVGIRYESDVAILRVEGPPLQPASVAPALPRQGQAVAAIGMPLLKTFGLYTGVVSQYNATDKLKPGTRLMLIDRPGTSGLSGGPVFNAAGEVVGMMSHGNERFSLAVPIDRVMRIADDLIGGAPKPAP